MLTLNTDKTGKKVSKVCPHTSSKNIPQNNNKIISIKKQIKITVAVIYNIITATVIINNNKAIKTK
jgi:hypothetical protein